MLSKYVNFSCRRAEPRNIGKGNGNGKGKFRPGTGHEGPEWEMRYSYILSLISTPAELDVQRKAPLALTPGRKHSIHCI